LKARGIILVDFDFDGFREAAEMQDILEKARDMIITDNKYVVHHQTDLKERRGDHAPDLRKMKFRNN
jgi:hypothetical protein